MRKRRIKAPEEHEVGVYHCVSRVVEKRYHIKEAQKEEFVRLLKIYERFCGVRVITHCVMSNHFHVLAEVPKRPEVLPSDAELIELVRLIYTEKAVGQIETQLKNLREQNPVEAEAFRERFFRRMWDVSEFMAELKQRFTGWFNKKNNRVGTFWEGRFKSSLVQGKAWAVAIVAAYIDLNPVRAGIVDDPKDYRWSGYGEAVSGNKHSVLGLAIAVEAQHCGIGYNRDGVWSSEEGREFRPDLGYADLRKHTLESYRILLYEQGREGTTDPYGKVIRRGFTREQIAEVLKQKGKLPWGDLCLCKVRYFLDGAVIGSREFVEEIFGRNRDQFSPRRTSGAREIREMEDCGVMVLRQLRRRPCG